MNTAQPVLQLHHLTVSYGGIHAVHGISLEVFEGEVVTLIGANGAGKSSTLRAISGLLPYEGTVTYRGKDLRGTPAHAIAGAGIAHVPEGRGIFGNLSVMENLIISTWQRRDKEGIRRDRERVFGLFPRLHERRNQHGGTLSGGEQQMLAIGRALMSGATLLLLDEPSMGLSPILVEELFNLLARLNREGTTILLVEQNANMALDLAGRGYVLETGTIFASGTALELRGNPAVREAYLGL